MAGAGAVRGLTAGDAGPGVEAQVDAGPRPPPAAPGVSPRTALAPAQARRSR
jgi:hypothetical protein